MDKLLSKKINLLVHLANVDGKFDETEQKLLHHILQERGLEQPDVTKPHLDDFVHIENHNEKVELLYWAIRMMRADNIVHQEEVAYCKALAIKLNFDIKIVDYYSSLGKELSLEDFERIAPDYMMAMG